MVVRKLNSNSAKSALILNTKECCFICLKCIRRDFERVNLKFESDQFSLSVLLQYLNINAIEVISQACSDSVPQSKSTSLDSDIAAQLCEDCLKINGKIQELVNVIEVTKMKINYHLNSIHEKVRDAGRTPSRMIRYHRRMTRDPSLANSMESTDKLRKRISTQCNEITVRTKSQPRVHISRLDSNFEIRRSNNIVARLDDNESLSPPELTLKPDSDTRDADLSQTNELEECIGKISNVQSLSMEKAKNVSFENVTMTPAPVTLEKLIFKTESEEPKQINIVTERERPSKRKYTMWEAFRKVKFNPKIRSGSRVECSICRRTYKNILCLRVHISTTHKKTTRVKGLKSNLYYKVCYSKGEVISDQNAIYYKKQFACSGPGCGRTFSALRSLKRHRQLEHSKKGQPETANDLKTQRRKKRGSGPVECKICGKTYACAGNLQEHHKSVHLGVKRFEYDFCGKKFSKAKDGRKHREAIHLGIRHFCDFPGCGKSYSSVPNLRTHQRLIHPGWYPSTKVQKSSKKFLVAFPPSLKQELN